MKRFAGELKLRFVCRKRRSAQNTFSSLWAAGLTCQRRCLGLPSFRLHRTTYLVSRRRLAARKTLASCCCGKGLVSDEEATFATAPPSLFACP